MAYFVRGGPNQARENPALLYNWLPTITFLAQQRLDIKLNYRK